MNSDGSKSTAFPPAKTTQRSPGKRSIGKENGKRRCTNSAKRTHKALPDYRLPCSDSDRCSPLSFKKAADSIDFFLRDSFTV